MSGQGIGREVQVGTRAETVQECVAHNAAHEVEVGPRGLEQSRQLVRCVKGRPKPFGHHSCEPRDLPGGFGGLNSGQQAGRLQGHAEVVRVRGGLECGPE